MTNIDRSVEIIEKTFFEYLSKSINESILCKRLSDILSSSELNGATKEFTVNIIDGKSQFLGMCCYPDMKEYSDAVLRVYNNTHPSYQDFNTMWFTCIKHFYVEIDKNIFDRKVINFTPQELTAILLHELSHVVYSDKTTEKLYKAYRLHKNHLENHTYGLTKVALSTLYIIPGIIACSAHKANTGKNGMKEEYICDKVFGLKNYQEHLVSALDKIIKAYGTRFVLDDGTSDKKIDATMKWVDFNVDNIVSRRDALGRELVNMASGSRSKYLKDCIVTITKRLGIGMRDKYTTNLIAMESVFEAIENGDISTVDILDKYDICDDLRTMNALQMEVNCSTQAFEAAIRNKKGPKLPNGFEIDSIMIEIDRVRTHTDRLYALDLIYDKMDKITEFEEYYGKGSPEYNKYHATIERYKDQLDQMRSLLLNKHNLEKTYKVFTKCPVGYEG